MYAVVGVKSLEIYHVCGSKEKAWRYINGEYPSYTEGDKLNDPVLPEPFRLMKEREKR